MPTMFSGDIPWYVSLSDVVQHPDFEKDSDSSLLKKILYDLGMDVEKGFNDDMRWTRKCTYTEEVDEFDYRHRSLSGHVMKCPRYVGVARRDGPWKKFISHFLNLPAEFSGENLRK